MKTEETFPISANTVSNWGKILLDTSFIIRVINFKRRGAEVNRFSHELMSYLSNTEYQVSNSKTAARRFYISAISIAEILENVEDSVEKSKVIIQALDANNIEILDFDEDVANVYNRTFCKQLGKVNQDKILKRWGEENSKRNREALTNDLMILGCGVGVEVDTVLCFDKGMYRISKECGLNAVYAKREYFRANDTYIFEFNKRVADRELHPSLV